MAAAAYLSYWSGRLACADYLATRGRQAAIELAHGDADIRLRLAGENIQALAAAAQLDPSNAETWVRLGVAEEMRGFGVAAEPLLLRAAAVSRLYGPRWALASFYFRRNDSEHFQLWAAEALRVGSTDLDPLFELCWNISKDGAEIQKRAIPPRALVLDRYVTFLLRTGRLAASEPVARALADRATSENLSTLSYWLDVQLDRGAPLAALDVWNRLCVRRLLPYAPLDPADSPLNDGDFALASAMSGGYVWRLSPQAGAGVEVNRKSHYLRVEFSGSQPEWCAPLQQYVPLLPKFRYRFRFWYRTADIEPAGGLHWAVLDARTGTDLAESPSALSSESGSTGEIAFRAPQCGLVRLVLVCSRVAGKTRPAGSIELRDLRVERVP